MDSHSVRTKKKSKIFSATFAKDGRARYYLFEPIQESRSIKDAWHNTFSKKRNHKEYHR